MSTHSLVWREITEESFLIRELVSMVALKMPSLNIGPWSREIDRGGLVSNQITICVVGLGYVGLPTVLAFHKSGYRIIGIDVNTEIINSLKRDLPFIR